jgi:hypothetical protein
MNKQQIRDFVKDNYLTQTDEQLGEHCGINAEQVRKIRKALKLRKVVNSQNKHLVDNPPQEVKHGLELRGENIVIN